MSTEQLKRWLEASVKASGVPLKVRDKGTLLDLARLLRR